MSKTLTHPLNIILLGDPAAGKATQAKLLVKKYKLYDFDMGAELMRRRKKDKALDKMLRAYNDEGKLTPTKVVREILDEVIHATPKAKGILFDGHPKMVGEARLVRKWLRETYRVKPLVIYLKVPVSETVKRMSNRLGYFAGKYGKRPDDTVAALKNRQNYYRKNVSEVIKFFKKEYTFIEVSGVGTPAAVQKRMQAVIAKHEKKTAAQHHPSARKARQRSN